MRSATGFGWRLVAFDPATRTGEVALHQWRYPFAAPAAGDEDLRVGDHVFVRLLSSTTAPHVARVWPCLARVRARPELAAAPALADPTAAAGAVGQVPAPVDLAIIDHGGGRLWIAAHAADRYPYCGPLGVALTVHGGLRCAGARPADAGTVAAACVRLALPEERALVHAGHALTGGRVVVALVEARDEFSPERDAGVVLVTCDAVTWQPGPSDDRARAAEAAFAASGVDPDALSAVLVADGWLVAVTGDARTPFLPLLDAADAAAFAPWCEVLTVLVRQYAADA